MNPATRPVPSPSRWTSAPAGRSKGLFYEDTVGPVGVEDTVQVVALVLEDDGRVAVHLLGDRRAFRSEVGDVRGAAARDDTPQPRDGKTALGTVYDGPGEGVDMDVDISLERTAGLVIAHDTDDAAVDAYLRSRNAHPVLGRVGDGLQHLGDEGLQLCRAQLIGTQVDTAGAEDGAVHGHGADIHHGVALADDGLLPGSPAAPVAAACGQNQQTNDSQ